MADASLRGQLLRLLLLPVAGILAVSSVAAYYLAREPATDAYDGALIDAGIALADRIHVRDGTLAVDLPSAAEQVLRTDQFDTIYYLVRDPSGKLIAGDAGIPPPPSRSARRTARFFMTQPTATPGFVPRRCWRPAAARSAPSRSPRRRASATAWCARSCSAASCPRRCSRC